MMPVAYLTDNIQLEDDEFYSAGFCENTTSTNHLTKRLKERTGIPKKSHQAFLDKAIEHGLRAKDLVDIPVIHNYIRSISKDGYTLILYNYYMLIYNNSGVGITIIHLPKEYQKILSRKKKDKNHKLKGGN